MTTQENPSPSRLVSNPRLWLAGLMGFAGGLPILLTITVLQAWLMAESIDLTTIGILGLVALPYNLKFVWASFLDRFNPLGIGRRRSWLITTQACLAASIAILGTRQPLLSMWSVTLAAFLVTFFSASQDIVIDAYRRETLSARGLLRSRDRSAIVAHDRSAVIVAWYHVQDLRRLQTPDQAWISPCEGDYPGAFAATASTSSFQPVPSIVQQITVEAGRWEPRYFTRKPTLASSYFGSDR